MRIDCSYGVNVWAQYVPDSESDTRYWRTLPGNGAAHVPLLLESVYWWSCHASIGAPPAYEDAWSESTLPCCMNRHHGFVSAVFMDFSIRPVGLKELWTLKWHPEFNTQGPWTRAGGIRPDDWPQWMRPFKDY